VSGGFVADAEAPSCACPHYHAPISIAGHGGPFPDLYPTACGHGCVVDALPKDLAVTCY
jgi:hypothetical protein